MSKRPSLYVVGSKHSQRKIVPLRFARAHSAVIELRASVLTLTRETSWRDLVRRLAKSPLKN